MGYYTVWVVGPNIFDVIKDYEEVNDIPATFPGLTYDYFGDIEEPGPAHHFATLPDEEFPFAIVTAAGQIIDTPHPESKPDPSVTVGIDQMRRFLDSHPNDIITAMTWHT